MGYDDDGDCPEHVWQLTDLTLGTGGAHVGYECERCGAVLMRAPGEAFPGTT